MATIKTRETTGGGATVVGSPLTNADIDNNFISLNVAKLEDITGESIKDLSDVNSSMTPTAGQLLTWNATSSKWEAANAPISLPAQTGNSGKYLTTNGTAASWDQLDIADVNGLQTALNAKAPLASPALTGTPTAPTAAAGTNTTQVATTAFVSAAVSNLVDAAPAALNTLNELAAALGDDANFSTTVTNAIAAKQDAATAITTSNIGSQTVATAGSCTGNAATATKLATARTIGGVSFDGSANINLPGVNTAGNQSTTGNAATATKLATARTIGGVSFDGSANINLPGVNAAGNQSTTGNAATATKLATARTIGGVSFDGSANINLPGVNTAGNQSTTGNAATATTATNTSGGTVNANYIGVSNTSGSTGYGISLYNGAVAGQPTYGLFFGQTATFGTYGNVTGDWATYFTMNNTANRGWVFRQMSTGVNVASINNVGAARFASTVTAPTFSGALSGNATTATTLATARTINGTSFNGSGNITTANWGTARTINGSSVNGSANVTTANWGTARTINGVSVNGSTNYTLEPYVERDDSTNAARYLTFVDSITAGYQRLNMDTNFSYNPSTNTLTAGTFSGALSGNATTASSCSGNAATATTLATARTINGVSFNGSANITVTANTTNTLTRGSYLTGNNFNGSAATTWAVDAATANTASKVVARDASGNFSAGTITATTFTTSDRTLKDNIRNVRGALDKVLQLNGVEFTWIKDGTSSAGVIAQDVEKVLPQAIGRNDDGKKTVQYDALHALLIEAIKELQGQVVDLKSAIKILTA